ncbi:Zn(2)-C6 fungal-type domain-containing protein [Trichoderma simmonsii]|uniref:Zn(2)-C6 fungal-type domain-containing protein n=1 Tax=Trichoderma simmonsii TaxID=1491479 RepID=A0A8G0PF35_9HYPO|nr:Zn(2)-C6 fungal-type domain-containing protein [Trichoderma simmonsii]
MENFLSILDDYPEVSHLSPTFSWATSPVVDQSIDLDITPADNIEDNQVPVTPYTEAQKDASRSLPVKTCLACRRKHLKCSGSNPCARCITSQVECVFIPSQRGYNRLRRATIKGKERLPLVGTSRLQYQPPSPGPSVDAARGNAPNHNQASDNRAESHLLSAGSRLKRLSAYATSTLYNQTSSPQLTVMNDSDRPLTSFYYHAFASNPFVLPRCHLSQIDDAKSLHILVAAMRWVGSLYINATVQTDLYNAAHSSIYDDQAPRNGFLVQAMMLLLVALDGSCQRRESLRILSDVELLALEIGLNKRNFAALHGRDSPVLEESWRRTWWYLYIMDGMIAGIHRQSSFALFNVSADVLLPCEEHQYLSGEIPKPLSLPDLQDRNFHEDEHQFSSFAQLIICGQNLGKFLRLPPICNPEDPNVKELELLLTSWRLHLPHFKRHMLQQDGEPDEMMFQAYMITYAILILLYQPYCRFDIKPAQAIDTCAPVQTTLGNDYVDYYTTETVSSATAISAMITQKSLLSHTHFFTCALTLSSIVHLSHWALLSPDARDSASRESIRLNLGALKLRARVWPAAAEAQAQVAAVAKTIYRIKKTEYAESSLLDLLINNQT